jgi:hypothetical protein
MKQAADARHWWRRASAWLGLLIVGACVTWGVTQLLDEGRKSLDPLVRISVQTDPAEVFAPTDPGWETYAFVSHRDATGLGKPPSQLCREWRSWALARGGVDADETTVYAVLQGEPGTAVAITGAEVEVTRRDPALAGTSAHCSGGGAAASPRLIDIDLDDPSPEVLYANPGDDYPARRRLLLTLNGTETETLRIVAHTRRCDCQWRVRLHMVVNGARRAAALDDGGQPFRTSASARSAHVQWAGGRWAPMSPKEWRASLPTDWSHFRGVGP